MISDQIRDRFLKFFAKRGHTIIPSASLVPENDPSVLFNTAGMQPLAPYLLGQKHPAGNRLVDVQKCVRTTDIDDIGDNTHLTFFQMLGNWSLGDPKAADGVGASYFKEEAIKWSYELLTSKDEGFGLDPKRLYITIFAGDQNAPLDEESKQLWQSIGIPANRIYALPAENNWWSPGDSGPCGPDTEMFYDVTEQSVGDLSHEQFLAADERREVVEIWNDVFMEYEKKDGVVIGKLAQKNVDTGAGLERLAMVLNKKDNVYDTDLFTPIIESIKKHDPWNLTTSELPDENRFGYEGHKRSVRIIADHIRTSVFMVNDGVVPSNTDRGYVLRRLIRRAVFHCIETNLQMMPHDLIESVTEIYKGAYPEILHKEQKISDVIREEENKFLKTLSSGKNELQKMAMGLWQKSVQGHVVETAGLDVTGKNLFFFYSTYGFPFELSIEEINKIRKHLERDYGLKPLSSDEIENLKKDFDSEMKNHQELSKSGSDQKFKGGLGGNSQQIVRYHTATHLLHQALRDVLGPEVAQRGSNITDERLRFDFAYPSKLTDEQKQAVEQIVNDKIQADLPVNQVTLPKAEAEKSGANHLFSEKYGDEVSVYFIGSDLAFAYSKEFCGGPHVTHTAELGHFKITKEEAVAAGIRRIKAVLE